MRIIRAMILYAAADLVWATRIKSTAESLGIPCRPARTPEMLRARLDEGPVRAILLDLDDPAQAFALLEVLRGEHAGPLELGVRVVVWGPHVATDLFERARREGADEVMARGSFSSTLPGLLRRLGGGGAGDAGG